MSRESLIEKLQALKGVFGTAYEKGISDAIAITQDAFDAWNAGAQSVARIITESTVETEALRKRILGLASSE